MADEIQWWLEDHALPVIAVLMIALAIVAYMVVNVQRGKQPVSRDEAEIGAVDEAATTDLRAAATALDTYAEANGGSFAGATAAEIESLVPPDTELPELVVNATQMTYSISVTSGGGATYSINRAASGDVTYPCSPPGLGLCRDTLTWA
jgi:hypothetical protein